MSNEEEIESFEHLKCLGHIMRKEALESLTPTGQIESKKDKKKGVTYLMNMKCDAW